jgi:hypothetical protein
LMEIISRWVLTEKSKGKPVNICINHTTYQQIYLQTFAGIPYLPIWKVRCKLWTEVAWERAVVSGGLGTSGGTWLRRDPLQVVSWTGNHTRLACTYHINKIGGKQHNFTW